MLRTALFIMFIVSAKLAFAQPWYFPGNVVHSTALSNNSTSAVELWMAASGDTAPSAIVLAPHEQRRIELPAASVVRVFSYLELKVTLDQTPSGRSDTRILLPRTQAESGVLTVVNLSSLPQAEFSLLAGGMRVRVPALAPLAQAQINLQLEPGMTVVLNAPLAIAAGWSFAGQVELLRMLPSQTVLWPKTTMAHFLLTSADGQQSYVLPTDDPQIIAQARAQIGHRDHALILTAQIQAGHGDTNCDLKSNFKTPWSWSVLKALEFSQFASESCNGDPQSVEDDLQLWLEKGRICFWGFQIERELSLHEVQFGF